MKRSETRPRRGGPFVRWYALAWSFVFAWLLLLNLPFYAGASLGAGRSFRMEHGRLTLRVAEGDPSQTFWLAHNSEGLRWHFESLVVDAANWEVTIPLWIPLAPAALLAAWAWSRRPPT